MSDPVCDICGKPGTSMFYPAGLGWQKKPTVWYCDSHNPFSSGEVARLTAERDGLRRIVDSRDWEKAAAENAALRADLAAAREMVEGLIAFLEVHSADAIADSTYAVGRVVETYRNRLSRLGTVEALQAVREAQKMFKQVCKFDHCNEVTHFAQEGLARLKAVFGE